MAQSHHPNSHFLSEAEYLESELTSEIKREYIDGQIFAMAGAGFNHNCIAINIVQAFANQLKGTACLVFMADMKIKTGKNFFYPDVLVDCSKMASNDYFSTSPVIIVEVLSSSTRKRDLTTKLIQYINIPSLQEYVLIEQDFVQVQVLRKRTDWKYEYFFLGDSITFEAIDLTLAVEEIYDHVDNEDLNKFRQQKLLTSEE